MSGLKCAWVTVVWDEESCLQALVLGKSLRRAVTSAEIVVLVSQNVSLQFRNTLQEVFDVILGFSNTLSLANDQKFNNLSALNEAKLYSWSLTMYKKCVVLDPSILVLKNCDELFGVTDDFSAFLSDSEINENFDDSLLVITPSYATYMEVTSHVPSLSQGSSNLKSIIKSLHDFRVNIMKSLIIERVGSATSNTYKDHLKLLNFKDVKPWLLLNDYDIMTTRVHVDVKIWIQVFKDDVLPCIHKRNLGFDFQLLGKMKGNNNGIKEKLPKDVHNDLKDSIAIVGHSVRLPGANNIEEFWDMLKSGGDGISTIPLDRLPEHLSHDPRFNSIQAGFLKCPIDEFDSKFFGISPREAAFMDPQQRLMVEVAWEALEDAAINPQALKGSNTGVFSGIWTHEYERLLSENTTGKDFHHIILGNAFSATSARVSYFLGLNGPNVATESGCSSSMVALHFACDSLRKRETDLALATGVNLLITNFPYSEIPILANDGHCKTFDESADGFVRAEGVVVVVLKRFSDAVTDGDRILSVIRGSGISNEGTTTSFGTPSKYCQQIAIKEALKASGVKPEDVDYVEAHGTGTPIGDPIEFAAISAGYKAQREKPLIVGSVKTNTGHTESAAGLAGLVKVVLAMENEIIPPHRNLTVMNPNIDLDSLPAVIPINGMKWPRNSNKRRLAGVSSFGISGTNVHVILEEPPELPEIQLKSGEIDRTHHILTLSAKTENALKDLADSYCNFVDKNTELSVEDICFTANIGRQNHKHRMTVVAKNLDELKEKLTKPAYNVDSTGIEKPKIAFLFTGQGSQYSGMAKCLYDTSPVFKRAFNDCNEILINNAEISLIDALWDHSKANNSLDETIYSQTAIFCIEYSLLNLWESWGINPDYVLGHSVGEFAASVAAGFMTLEDAIALVAERSRLIHNLAAGGMLAIRSNKETVDNIIKTFSTVNPNDWLDIAVINSPEEIVVAGKTTSLKKLVELCESQNIKTQLLAASHAFHSRDMEDMLQAFGKVANNIQYNVPRCKYVSGSTGEILSSEDMSGKYWQNHARYTVDFTKGMKLVHEEGCNVFIEIGAHPILLALGMSNFPLLDSHNFLWLPSIRRNEDNWITLLNSVSKLYINGVDIDWRAFDDTYLRKKVSLPHYPFQRQKYWIESRSEPKTKPLHPLLGRKVPLAVVKDNVYQHVWDLNDFPYLKDHQVANIIVLPGAGFLEIILAVGCEAFHDESNKNILVEDFLVEAPMELLEDELHKIQIVASESEDNDSFLVKVFMYKNMNGYNDEKGWKQYASAKVSSCLKSKHSTKLQNCEDLAIDQKEFEIIKSRCSTEISTGEFYEKTAEIGINFGETFRSISKVWKGTNEIIAEIPCPTKAGNMKDYILHPIVLDAMIQAVGLCTRSENSGLYLPVGIPSFTMNQKSDSLSFFAHVFEDLNNSPIVQLYNDKFQVICSMSGVRLVKTSIASFMNVINAHKNRLPGMYEINWRYRDSVLHSRVNLTELPKCGFKEVASSLQEFAHMPNIISEQHEIGVENIKFGITCAFHEIGWNYKVGDRFSLHSFVSDLTLVPSQSQFIQRLLNILADNGILRNDISDGDPAWVVIETLLPYDVALKTKADAVCNADKLKIPEMGILRHCVDNLSDVLTGRKTALDIIFGNEDPLLNPMILYTQGMTIKLCNIGIRLYLQSKLNSIKTTGSVVRILEIGAGSGATSLEILQGFQKLGIPCRYTFTDVTPHFLEKAKEGLKKYTCVEYKVLNIERDPKYQGFVPHSYDIIVAANVIHATEYLEDSVRNIRQLLSSNGILVLQEMLKPLINVDLIFGMLEGYWRYKDYHVRGDHPCVNQQIWTKILMENGFDCVENISHPDDLVSNLISVAADVNPKYIVRNVLNYEESKLPTWVIISQNDNAVTEKLKLLIANSGDSVINVSNSLHRDMKPNESTLFVDYNEKQQFHDILNIINEKFNVKGWLILLALDNIFDKEAGLKPFLYISQYLSTIECHASKILVATRGSLYIGDQVLGYPNQGTLWGFIKSFYNESLLRNVGCIDLDPDNCDPSTESVQLFSEMWSMDGEILLAYRNNKRHVMRLTPLRATQAPLVLPKTRYEIVVPKSKKIDDLSFAVQVVTPLQLNEVEVSVKATGLNFRDVMVIIKIEQYHTLSETVGCDFSGVVTRVGSSVSQFKIGDEVFGMANRSSVASHVVVNDAVLFRKPKEFTFAEVCTLPAVFLTAYYCLVSVADLKKGETLLIHVASGGVGLVAIQIAQHIGANIIATAGSKRKRGYLRSLGIQHVFHSRDLTYGDEILKATNGKGVDVVLNSLTGIGFKETSLKICSKNSKFLEIGKVNIWQPNDVQKLRSDVKYTIVNLETVIRDDLDKAKILQVALNNFLKEGILKPLPYTRYFVSQIKDAMDYFLKAQHIGKIVVTMPESNESLSKNFTNDLVFNANGTYLVTGGLGGIGLEVAKWMVKTGARNVVLVGRTAPDENTLKVLKSLSTRGCRVLSRQVDVGEMDQCVDLFKVIKSDMPPLRGVIHSAGTLSDAMIRNQTWEKFETVFQAKVKGGWNLHNLTKDLSLEHFVLFSSMAGIIGSPGQSNHSAANTFLDSLVHYRHSLGLPAQTINWGAWSELGAAKDTAYGKEGAFGIKPFTPTQGISALKFCMSQPILQVGILQVDWSTFTQNFDSSLFFELNVNGTTTDAQSVAQTEQFWTDIESLAEEERALYIKNCIEGIIRKTLKLPESETIDEYQTFSEMGLDSLMAVEMRNKLQLIFGKHLALNPTSLLDYPTLATLSKYLAELTMSVNTEEILIKNDEVETSQESFELAKRDSILLESVKKVDEPVVPSKIKNVLLTGVTGHFGPYMLNELDQNDSIHIYCLIRATSLKDAEKRLNGNLKKFHLLNTNRLNNMSIVLGDITKENFGMMKEDYEKIAFEIDAIIHCAVRANHIESYKKSKSNKDIRSVNVLGTLEILKFASCFRTKRVIFTTSYSAANVLDSDGFVSDELPLEENTGEGLGGGYPLTKFVGEKLMKQAMQRGIPCTVLRFPSLIGHSETGLFTPDTNFIMNLLFSAGRMKIFADIRGGWNSMPVDVAAKIACCIVFNDNAQTGLYNIVSKTSFTSREFVNVANEMGLELLIVDQKEFAEKLMEDDNPLMTMFKEGMKDKNPIDKIVGVSPAFKHAFQGNKEIFRLSNKLLEAVKDVEAMIPSTAEMMRRQIRFAINAGMFENLGIQLDTK